MSFRDLFRPKRDPHTGLAYEAAPPIPPSAEDLEAERLALREREAGYRRGRAEQKDVDRKLAVEARRRRGGFGLVSALLVVAAVLGVTWMVLAYQAGSFAGGGAVVDQKVAAVTEPAKQAAVNAIDRTGEAVESVGQKVEEQGSKIRQKAQ